MVLDVLDDERGLASSTAFYIVLRASWWQPPYDLLRSAIYPTRRIPKPSLMYSEPNQRNQSRLTSAERLDTLIDDILQNWNSSYKRMNK